MNTAEILAALDAELVRLRHVRELLAGAEQGAGRRPGRPKGAKAADAAAEGEGKKRVLSPEARERIAAAQRARWAAHSASREKEGARGASTGKKGRGAKRGKAADEVGAQEG